MLADTKALENLCTSRRCWGVDLPVRWHVWLEKMEIGVEVLPAHLCDRLAGAMSGAAYPGQGQHLRGVAASGLISIISSSPWGVASDV